jgi:precorrin-4/cobalt-precorrin-4 C11-methyltransferase
MTVYFVGAGPGNPELLTCRAANLLRSCEVCIYAGSLVSPEVLELIPAMARSLDSASMTLDQIISEIEIADGKGQDVVRLHTGDPSLYGAINEQMRRLDEKGIPYEVIPGVSAFQAAAAAVQTELTAPEISQTVILTRMAGRTPVPKGQELSKLAQSRSTLCLFLSVHLVADLVEQLEPHYGEDCPVAVVYRASWPDQQIIRGMLKDIESQVADAGFTKTTLIIVGWALAKEGPDSKLYDPEFAHGYRAKESS